MKKTSSTMATAPSKRATPNEIWTPLMRPNTWMSAPPTSGPRAMGMRRVSEWRLTPIVRLSFGTALLTSDMIAGREIAVHEMKKTAPMRTAHHVGTRMTITYPHHRDEVEYDERFLVAQQVAEVSARKAVQCRQQVVHAVQRADRPRRTAHSHEIERQEPLGHLFAHAHQNNHGEQGDHTGVQRKEAAEEAGNATARHALLIHLVDRSHAAPFTYSCPLLKAVQTRNGRRTRPGYPVPPRYA